MMTKKAQYGRRFCSKRRVRCVIPKMKRAASRRERRTVRQMLTAGNEPIGLATPPLSAWDIY
jgi:hypothetical protein